MADPIIEIVETVETEVIVEVDRSSEVIETVETETLVEVEVEVVEEVEQGIPGPRGPQGEQGIPGESSVGGLPIEISDPQPGEVLALQTSLKWANEDILDGGNF